MPAAFYAVCRAPPMVIENENCTTARRRAHRFTGTAGVSPATARDIRHTNGLRNSRFISKMDEATNVTVVRAARSLRARCPRSQQSLEHYLLTLILASHTFVVYGRPLRRTVPI